MSLQQRVQDFMSVCEDTIGEQEDVWVVGAGGAGDEVGEEGGDGQALRLRTA